MSNVHPNFTTQYLQRIGSQTQLYFKILLNIWLNDRLKKNTFLIGGILLFDFNNLNAFGKKDKNNLFFFYNNNTLDKIITSSWHLSKLNVKNYHINEITLQIIHEYETPPQKEFSRGLEAIIQPCVAYLHQCRPLSVSITNALKFIKWQLTHLPNDESDVELKQRLLELVDTYIRDQIEKAAEAISISVQRKISTGDVILTFGCSSLINHILNDARKRNVDFRVIVVDARPDHEGQEMLRRLVAQNIRCTVVLINAVGFIMPEVRTRDMLTTF